MKIPIFEEIILKDTSVLGLNSLLEDSKIGRVPCYINLTELKAEELTSFLEKLEELLLEANLHPHFPYPLYLITTKEIKGLFPNVRSVKELPEHYFKKVKRPSNKETILLNKLSLKVDKINNLNLYSLIESLKQSSTSEKDLYNETKELYFYERLNDLLEKKAKNRY